MASVGHSLVGLSFAGFSDRESRGGKLPYVWVGFMVLMGHLVDVVEWIVIVVAPSYFDRHFVTNSPMVTAGIAAFVCLLLFVVFRVRRILVYVLTVLAIFSHLLLDLPVVLAALGDIYFGSADTSEMPSVTDLIPAELWAYGGVLLLVTLFNASRRKGVPRGGRLLSGVFAFLLVGTAVTRIPYLWGSVYALAGMHALLLYRRCWTWRVIWSLVPAAPLVVLLGFELWSVHLYHEATTLRHARQYAAAEATYRRMIDVPTRSPKELARVYLGDCLLNQGRFGEAEVELLNSIARTEHPDFGRIVLAAMYMSSKTENTEYHKLGDAVVLCEEILAGNARPHLKGIASRRLRELNKQGYFGRSDRPMAPVEADASP